MAAIYVRRGLTVPLYLFLGLMQAAAAMSAYWFVLRTGGWHFGDQLAAHNALYLQATTACLSAIVVMQVANVFLCRSDRQPLFGRGLTSNKLILAGIATEIALIALIDYTPWGNALFGTAPITAAVWLFMIPFALAIIGLEELRKRFVRAPTTAPLAWPARPCDWLGLQVSGIDGQAITECR